LIKMFKGVWSYPAYDFVGGPEKVEEMVNRLASYGFNLIIPAVKDERGLFVFKTSRGKRYPMVDEWDPLRKLVETAHNYGLEVHPWLCVFHEGEESIFLEEHPEYRALDIKGNPIKGNWACPGELEVQMHELELYKEVMENYDVDGVHLDYIRYANIDMCCCEKCKDIDKKLGIRLNELNRRHPKWPEWVELRIKNITTFVKRLREESKKYGLDVSAAVFSDYPRCMVNNGQDWVSWAEMKLVDHLFPMTYTQIVKEVKAATKNHVAQLKDTDILLAEGLAPWIPLKTSILIEEVKIAYLTGADGVIFYHYGSLTDEALESIKEFEEQI